ncbi:MAG: AAA family ATPase [Candidatus Magasanikbacteria bacterium]
MYVKKLEINGFKSFASNTVIDFPAPKNSGQYSVTAIVGPNGSGKSNVVDAIRWVLGEQSMKHLRGKKSEDVIFAGSEGKGKMGLASVTMLLDNKDKRIKIDYDEVEISRKIYRSGESEYLLNGSPTRLLDLQILLAQAQFGQGSYSVISQGTIDRLLLQTPAERKNFFDEAVGIKEFQIKRHHAVLKLNKTQENINQADLMLKEIEPHLKNLKRQVGKLEKRQEVEISLRDLQEKYYFTLHDNLSLDLEKLQSEHDNVSKIYEEVNVRLLSVQNELSKLAQEKSRQEVFTELQDEYQKLLQGKNSLERDQAIVSGKLQTEFGKVGKQNIGWLESKIDEFLQQEKNIEKDIEGQDKRKEEISNKMKSVSLDIEDFQNKKIKLQNRQLEIEHNLNELKQGKDSIQFEGLRAVNAILMQVPGKFGGKVHGLVAQLAKVDEKYRLALEVAAQAHLGAIVVENDSVAQSAIEFLKKQQLGFATFLPLNKIKGRFVPNDIKELENTTGVYGLAVNLVNYDLIYDDVFSYVFGSTLIVENIDIARKIGIGRVRMVTLEGDIMETSGSMKGGFRHSKKGVLSFAGGNQDFSEYAYEQLKQELLENKIKLDKMEIAIENLKENLMEQRMQEQMQSQKIGLLQNSLKDVSKELSQFKQELSMHTLSKEEYSEMMNTFSSQKEELSTKIQVLEDNISQVNKKIEQLNAEEEAKRQRIFSLQDSMQEEQESLNKQADEKHKLQVEIVKLQTHREDLEQEIFTELQEGIGNIKVRLTDKFLQEELESCKIEIEKLKYQLSLIGGIDESVMGEYEEIKARYDSLSFELDDLSKASADLEKMIEELDKLMKKKHKESFNKIKKEFSRYFKVLFEGGSAELVEVYGTEKDEDEMVLEGEVLSSENLQETDDLGNPVEKKNKRKILTGVEVYACPPGKKIKNISALSGGERTMTSIALLCAILHTNPSPFVILDEVEAALDEANTTRFTKILTELSLQSQFIVITHNRVTMHAVDVLYGVTMGNDGISKLLSVKLDN